MNPASVVPLWTASLLAIAWILVVFSALRKKGKLQNINAFWLALWSWPLLLAGEWLQIISIDATWVTLGILMVTPLLFFLVYSAVMAAIWESPKLQRLPFMLIGSSTIVLFGVQIVSLSGEWANWSIAAPVGMPIDYWPLYLSSLLVAFLLLYVFIMLVEQVQQYHFELPMQVVDTERYLLKGVVGAGGFTVGMGFMLVLLVVAVAFGVLPMTSWIRWFQLVVALSVLVYLGQLSRARTVSPSPFDHAAMAQAPKMSQAQAQLILKRAEATVISEKSYKTIGLRLTTFAKHAGLNPADICLALLAMNKHHFRNFIYQYRMKYAKQVFFSSDVSLEQVAKRLKLNGSGAVSGAFLKYLEKRHTNL